MLSKMKASGDSAKDVDGPKSPKDTFQVSASSGDFSYRLFEVGGGDPFFINMLLKASVDELQTSSCWVASK